VDENAVHGGGVASAGVVEDARDPQRRFSKVSKSSMNSRDVDSQGIPRRFSKPSSNSGGHYGEGSSTSAAGGADFGLCLAEHLKLSR
jgi:hypothetical protein